MHWHKRRDSASQSIMDAWSHMPTDVQALAARIAADATNGQIDDAAFRHRTKRTAANVLRVPEAQGPRRAAPPRPATSLGSRYVFVGVPDGAGGATCLSIARTVFNELAARLGGARAVSALARWVAVGHRPEIGMARSAYVRKRLQQYAAKAGRVRPNLSLDCSK